MSLTEKNRGEDVLGTVGLIKFPRSASIPLKHAAVLMSYLTFMFEISSDPLYEYPAWGVTANMVVRRLPAIRFDTNHAKTGGGEDVDVCLRLTDEHGRRLKCEPKASVRHEFWGGSALHIAHHFLNW
jgi:hypothetical protein